MALPDPEPATEPATTVAWLARLSCWDRATRARLAGSESLVVGGLAGTITTARVARGMDGALTLRKPPPAKRLRIVMPALSWLPTAGWPRPSFVRIALAISCPAWACFVPLLKVVPLGVN